MIRHLRLFGHTVSHNKFLSRRAPWWPGRATISTNSAIHRGLRKSVSVGRRTSEVSHRDGHRPQRSPRTETREDRKIARPNHQSKMDFEDIIESRRVKEAKRSPRQLKYLSGGRREDFRSGISFPARTGLHERNRHNGGSEGSERSVRNVDRYARDKKSSFATPASDRPNRAARRAAIFGTGDTLPGGLRVSKNEPNENRLNDSNHSKVHSTTSWRAASTEDKTFGESDQNLWDNRDWHDKGAERPFTSPGLATGKREKRSYSRTPSDNGPPENSLSTRSRAYDGGRDQLGIAGGDRGLYTRRHRDDERVDAASEPPLTIPYTTPASEFLYGTSVVNAALRYSHRKFYKLYIYSAPERVITFQDNSVRKFAESKGVEVVQVKGEWLRMLDKMSMGRPHNVDHTSSTSLKLLTMHRAIFSRPRRCRDFLSLDCNLYKSPWTASSQIWSINHAKMKQ